MPPAIKQAAAAKVGKHSQFPPAGQRAKSYKSKVYTLKEDIFVRIRTDPPRALADYLALRGRDAELADWTATHICMLRAGAAKGAWMSVSADQRTKYALQLLGRLENPNESQSFVIE